jgi:curved DNA-binding protein CbpA
MTFIDYYKVLGVQPNSTEQEIKDAYRKLSKKFHPDLNDGDNFFAERFKEIQTAYEILSDSSKRQEYNRQFETQSGKSESTDKKTNDNSKTQYNQNQSSNSDSTSSTPTQKSKKRNYSWLYITLPVMIVIGLIRGAVKKSIQENAINEAVNTYQPSNTNTYTNDTFAILSTSSSTIDTNQKIETEIPKIDTIKYSASTENILPVEKNYQELNQNTQNDTETDKSKATKEETENWLVEKLNNFTKEYRNYKGNTYTGSFENFQDYKFSFSEQYLIVNYVKEFFMFSSTGGSSNKVYTNIISRIPIYDLKGFSNYGYQEGYDKTITSENGVNTVSYSLPLNFRTNGETDLGDRINSALKHLKRFYSKPKSNETF